MSIIFLFQVTNDLSNPRKERNVFKISETEDKTSGRRIGNFFVKIQKGNHPTPPYKGRRPRQSNP